MLCGPLALFFTVPFPLPHLTQRTRTAFPHQAYSSVSFHRRRIPKQKKTASGYQRSWHLASFGLAYLHIFLNFFQRLLFDSACPEFYFTTSRPHTGVLVRPAAYTQTPQPFQKDTTFRPKKTILNSFDLILSLSRCHVGSVEHATCPRCTGFSVVSTLACTNEHIAISSWAWSNLGRQGRRYTDGGSNLGHEGTDTTGESLL